MKKILLFIVALVATLSMNAQTTEIHNASGKVAAYLGADVNVKFGMDGSDPTIMVYKGSEWQATYTGSGYKVVSTPVEETFKAIYDTNDGVNTLTFYYDAFDHSGNGITVYEDGTSKYLFDNAKSYGAKWGYHSIREYVKSVVIDATVAKYSSLTSTAYMFFNMTNANSISGAGYLDVSNVTDMNHMFNAFGRSVTSLTAVPDVSKWDTGNVTDMSNMFQNYGYGSTSLATVPDVSGWKTDNVKNMSYLFHTFGASSSSLTAVPDVSGWKTDNVTNIASMFESYGYNWKKDGVVVCKLDLSGWNLEKVTSAATVFKFTPKTFSVTIPGKTGEKVNEESKWYYGSNGSSIAPPDGKGFTMFGTGSAAVKAEAGVSGNKVKWIRLWEGGPKFAEYNVGAKSVSDCGGYYAWGGSTDKDSDDRNTSASSLSGDSDTATKLWGGSWRMPTRDELYALTCNCDAVWTQENDIKGWKFTGRGDYSSNSVFLPVDGFYLNGTKYQDGSEASYWSSTPSDSRYAYQLWMSSYNNFMQVGSSEIKSCLSVRAVYDDTKGTAKRDGDIDVNWVQLWKDGPKFAEYNVGVTDGKAESYGGLYCWGKTTDRDTNRIYNEGTNVLTGTDDTATNLWGNNWRMPTKEEIDALLANCDVEWTAVGGVNGCKFTGRGDYKGNNVFLPAAGYFDAKDFGQTYSGGYWSSTPENSGNVAYYLTLYSSIQEMGIYFRAFGYSVRAVLAK